MRVFSFFFFFKQIKVTMNDEDMDTYVFAVGTRKALVRLQKEMQDLVCRVLLTQTIYRNGVLYYIKVQLQGIR